MFLCRSQGTECTGRPAPSHGPEDLQGPGLILAGSWWRGGSAAASAQRDVAGPGRPCCAPRRAAGSLGVTLGIASLRWAAIFSPPLPLFCLALLNCNLFGPGTLCV